MYGMSHHLGRITEGKKQSPYLLLQVTKQDWIMSLGLFSAFLDLFVFIILFSLVFSLIKMLSKSATRTVKVKKQKCR